MAEETIDIPMTPEKIELEVYHTRRNLTGNSSISKSGAKVLPNYLKASTGSCHDICKYGINHVLDKKARSPIPKKFTRRPGEGQDQVKVVIVEERKKKSVINPKPLPAAPASAKNVVVSSKYFTSPGNRMDVSAKHATDLRPKLLQTKNINTRKEMRTPKLRKVTDLVPPTVSLSPRPSIKRALVVKSGNYKDPKKVAHLKSQNNVRRAEPKQPIDEEVPEKTLYIIEPKPENPTQNGHDTNHSSQSLSSFPEGKNLERGRNGMHSSRSPPSSGNKNLRNIQNARHTTRSSSSSSLSSHKRSVEIDPISEGSGTKIENQIPNPKVKRTSRPRRVGIVGLEDKLGSPQKPDFRRGKVVDVLSKNTSPRKLRFRQRKVVVENQNGKALTKQRSLKKVVSIDELNGSKTEPMKVVLKHQAVEGKKSSQSLYNNVIEETARKLVQTRKSKVKALVRAFETVISLQDTKSSATTSVS